MYVLGVIAERPLLFIMSSLTARLALLAYLLLATLLHPCLCHAAAAAPAARGAGNWRMDGEFYIFSLISSISSLDAAASS